MRLASQKFRKEEKLRKSGEFERVFERGKKLFTPYFIAYIAEGSGRARVGIIASRKLGGAVERNRAKRRLREAYRRIKAQLKGGAESIIVARSAAKTADFEKMVNALQEAFTKAQAIKG